MMLDTNVVSELARPRPDPMLTEWIGRQRFSTFVLPFGALTEIQRGIGWIGDTDPSKADRLTRWLAELLSTDIDVPPLRAAAAIMYGKMTTCGALKDLWCPNPKRDRPSLGMDVMIAAQSIVERCPIVSLNHSDFLRVHQHFPLCGVLEPKNSRWVVPLSADCLVEHEIAPKEAPAREPCLDVASMS